MRAVSRALCATGLVAALCAASNAATGEQSSTLADQRGVGVTIYNADLALVRDRRRVTLPAGESHLALRDVSARIQPETALLQSVGAPGRLAVLEQNFNYDLLSPGTLLAKEVGRDVDVVHTNPSTGARTVERARVLSTNGGIVLRYADRIETSVDGSLSFPGVPDNLRDRPTLVTDVDNQRAGTQDVDLTYLTGGLSWKADYVALLSPNDDRLSLQGMITLQNQSGTTYQDAAVQVVAGEVNVVRNEMVTSEIRVGQTADVYSVGAKPTEQALFEYHLYTLQRRTTIADNQTKQVELLRAASVPVTKSLELRGGYSYYTATAGDLGTRLKVGTYVTFVNRGGQLGVPLPAGAVRVYKADNGGRQQFVGSDAIDHTPKNETVRLHLGDSFDVTASRKQTSYSNPRPGTYESAYEIVLRNAKAAAQTVLVVEPIPGDWTMLRTSLPYRKSSSTTATWNVRVPAGGSTTLTYAVRTRWT